NGAGDYDAIGANQVAVEQVDAVDVGAAAQVERAGDNRDVLPHGAVDYRRAVDHGQRVGDSAVDGRGAVDDDNRADRLVFGDRDVAGHAEHEALFLLAVIGGRCCR